MQIVRGARGPTAPAGAGVHAGQEDFAGAEFDDLARTVAAILPGGVPVEIVAPGGGQTPLQRYVPDIGRAAAELGLRVRVPLEEAIRRMAAWYERCPGYCSAIGAVP